MKTNTATAAKAITRMLYDLKKNDVRTTLHFPWVDDKGRQCVCDGFRAYRLTEHLPLEDRPADAGEPINLALLFDPINLADYAPVQLPAAAELKAFIAAERAGKGRSYVPLWDFGDMLPTVNALYLQELMTILPDAAEVFCKRGSAGMLSPLYAKGERGEAILLPVRISDKLHAKRKAEAAEQAAAERAAAEAAESKAARIAALEAEAARCQQSDDAASAQAAADAGWVFDASHVVIDGKTFVADYSVTPTGTVYVFVPGIDGRPDARYHIAPGSAMYAAAKAAAAGRPVMPAADSASSPAESPVPAEAPAAAPAVKPWIGSTLSGNGWKIAFDAEAERTRVIFDGKPSAAQHAAVTEAGFYWSAQLGSFNKKLTCKAYRAAQALAVTLANIA